MDIEDFIAARLAEDERIARGTVQWSRSWQDFTMPGELRDDGNAGTVAMCVADPDREHMARHDPARTLRRCAAIRALMRDAGSFAVNIGTPSAELDAMFAPVAAIWSDHPDYNAEWGSL